MPAPRLEAGLPALVPVPERGVGTLSLVLGGVAILAVGLAALGTANFAAAQFARSIALGWLTVAVAVAGFGLIGAGVWRGVRGFFGIGAVGRLRGELGSADALRARPLLRRWLARLPEGEVSAGNLDALDDPEALRALLRAGPIAELRG